MKRAFTAIEFIVVVAIIGILAAILYPVFHRANYSSWRDDCRSNLKQIAFAWQQYARDENGNAPTLALNGQFYGWSDAFSAYGLKPTALHCPSNRAPRATNPIAVGYSDYWMNSRVAGRNLKIIAFPARTILFGDGASGDARYAVSHLSQTWRNDEKSPAFRHQKGAVYAFVDGHVKWLKPEQSTVETPAAGAPTFLLR